MLAYTVILAIRDGQALSVILVAVTEQQANAGSEQSQLDGELNNKDSSDPRPWLSTARLAAADLSVTPS